MVAKEVLAAKHVPPVKYIKDSPLSRYLSALITEYIREHSDNGIHVYSPTEIYPHLVGRCPRYVWHVYRSRGEDLDSVALRRVTAGNLYHSFVELVFRDTDEFLTELEVVMELSDDVYLHGVVDAFHYKSPRYVVEIKTKPHLVSAPDIWHIIQLHTYMMMLGVDRGVLLYLDRSRFLSRGFEIRRDFELESFILGWLSSAAEYLSSDVPPDPRPLSSDECRFCPFSSDCPLFRKISMFFG